MCAYNKIYIAYDNEIAGRLWEIKFEPVYKKRDAEHREGSMEISKTGGIIHRRRNHEVSRHTADDVS